MTYHPTLTEWIGVGLACSGVILWAAGMIIIVFCKHGVVSP